MPEIASAKLSIDPASLPRSGSQVLDVGCGDGRHLRAAAERSCHVVGVDYDCGELRRARMTLAARSPGLAPHAAFIVADASHLPFRACAFDAVICTETLEHLVDDLGAMSEIARVLRDGGTLLGAVPTHFTERIFWRLSPGYRDAPGGHVRIYSPRMLIDRLMLRGLRVTRVRYAHFVDSIVWLRFSLTDLLRRSRPTGFEAAVALAVAAERPVPTWRASLRAAISRSRFIEACDTLGALVLPKSLLFVARKRRSLVDEP